MKTIIVTVILLIVAAVLIGRVRDNSLARKIGREVNTRRDGDPVMLLEKLQQLRDKGALTDAEFEAQKARILSDGG